MKQNIEMGELLDNLREIRDAIWAKSEAVNAIVMKYNDRNTEILQRIVNRTPRRIKGAPDPVFDDYYGDLVAEGVVYMHDNVFGGYEVVPRLVSLGVCDLVYGGFIDRQEYTYRPYWPYGVGTGFDLRSVEFTPVENLIPQIAKEIEDFANSMLIGAQYLDTIVVLNEDDIKKINSWMKLATKEVKIDD